MGDDLLQRWITDQGIVEQARPQRIGAAKLERRWRPVGFRIPGISGHIRGDLEGGADHRVEPAVAVIAVKTFIVSQRIAQADLGDVVPAAEGHCEPRCHIESVSGVHSGVSRHREHAHGRDVTGRLIDVDPDALHEGPLIGIDCSELARGVELNVAVVAACADHKAIALSEDLGVGRRLE